MIVGSKSRRFPVWGAQDTLFFSCGYACRICPQQILRPIHEANCGVCSCFALGSASWRSSGGEDAAVGGSAIQSGHVALFPLFSWRRLWRSCVEVLRPSLSDGLRMTGLGARSLDGGAPVVIATKTFCRGRLPCFPRLRREAIGGR